MAEKKSKELPKESPKEAVAVQEPSNNGAGSEVKLPTISPIMGMQRLETIKEQIQSHYIAALVYKDLEKNLGERDKLVADFTTQLNSAKEQVESLIADQQKLKSQSDELSNKQQECLTEYQNGSRELEEEMAELDRQIAELQRRKNEIIEMQEIRLKDQDNTQTQLQNEIEKLEQQVSELNQRQLAAEEQLAAMPMPAELTSIDRRINDMVHHICSIFEAGSAEHPDEELATRNTSPGLVIPPIFKLDPWVAEENNGLTMLPVPVGAKQVIVSLHMPGEKNFERYSAELYASNGRRVWNSDKLDIHGRAVVITFNSTFFLTDDYELRLRGRDSESSFTPIAEYYFHIKKD